jgi:hypothetical protein
MARRNATSKPMVRRVEGSGLLTCAEDEPVEMALDV